MKRQRKLCHHRRRHHSCRYFERLESRHLLAFSVVDSQVDMTGPEIEFDFSADVDPASLQASDLQIDAVPALSVVLTDADTAVFTLPALSAGPHTASIAAGAITDTSQVAIDAFNDSFTVGATAEFDIKHSPRLQLGDAPLDDFTSGTTDQVNILWQTVPAPGGGTDDSFTLAYRQAGSTAWAPVTNSITQINTGVENRIIRQVLIDGLTYDTDYDYRVRHLRGGVLVTEYSDTFRTRLAVGDASNFTFAAYGDTAYIPAISDFELVQSRLITDDPAFTLLLGDSIYNVGSQTEADARFDPTVAPNATQFSASHIEYVGIGNHDIATASGQPTEDNFSVPIPVAGLNAPFEPPIGERAEHNYSFDYGGVHFVTFDTNSLNDPARLDAQLDYVVNDLNASNAQWKVVFGHHPIAGTPDKPENPAGNYYQQIVSRLGPSGAGVDLFMMGHSHTASRTFPLTGQSGGQATFVNDLDQDYAKGAGLIQVVSGVGGKSLRPGDYSQFPFVAAGFSLSTSPLVEYGYTKVDVTPTQLTVSYIAADDGAVIDSFTLTDMGDATPPTADLIVPDDNGLDDLDPAISSVSINTVQSDFQVQLLDSGDGIDDATVTSQTVSLSKDSVPLVESVDYTFGYNPATNVIMLTPIGLTFGEGDYDLTLNGGASLIADLAGNNLLLTPLTIYIDTTLQAIIFQQGVSGYTSTVDTFLQENLPTANNSATTALNIDSDDPPGSGLDAQGLLRFDNIIGGGVGQVPSGASVISATLDLEVFNPGSSVQLHRMLQTWSDTDTWNLLGSGVQANDVEAASAADATTGSVASGTLSIDVTSSLQSWLAAPGSDLGWVLLPTGTDGVDFDSSEGAKPPKLSVTYSFPLGSPFVSISATDSAASETGPDNGVFTLTRTGDTGSSLQVFYSISGTAIGGSDYTPLTGMVTFVAGSATADVIVTPINDVDLEPAETVIVTLSADPAYNVGSPFSDTVTIADDDFVVTAPPLQIIDNGDSGYSTVGPDWLTGVGFGHESDFELNPAGSGSEVAEWTFSGLTPGLYRVSATWVAAPNLATNAPFTVFDGAVPLTTVNVNQQLAPANFAFQGTNWQFLGDVYQITGDSLVVQLSDGADNTVLADAIQIEQIPGNIIDNGESGYSTVGNNWLTSASGFGFDGDIDLHSPGSGAELASWTFSGLSPGNYRVSATWFPIPGLATDAPFTVFDGAAPLSTVTVNQQLEPSTTREGGVLWEQLGGPYTITGSTLVVELNNLANGIVTADAIHIEYLPGTIIDDGESGYSTVGGWFPLAIGLGFGFQGDLDVGPAGTGADIATWTFSGLTPGLFRVSATWLPLSGLATDAPFTVLDGATPIGTVDIDLTQQPNDLANAGAFWQDLGGLYAITGSTLAVQLSDEANFLLLADAVRIERVGELPSLPSIIMSNLAIGAGLASEEQLIAAVTSRPLAIDTILASEATLDLLLSPPIADPLHRLPDRASGNSQHRLPASVSGKTGSPDELKKTDRKRHQGDRIDKDSISDSFAESADQWFRLLDLEEELLSNS